MTPEKRAAMMAAFETMSPAEQDAVLAMLQAILDEDTDASRRRLQRAKSKARRAAFALRNRAADDDGDVQIDMDVWGSLFDGGNE